MLYRNRRQQVSAPENEASDPVEHVDVKLLNDDGLKLVLSRINFLQQQFSNYLNQKHHEKQTEVLTSKISELSKSYEKQIEQLKNQMAELETKMDGLLNNNTQPAARDLPVTSYKKELATKQANNVVKWLLSKYESFVDDDDHEQYSLPPTEWYRQYQKWCEACGESKVYLLSIFNQMMNSEGFVIEIRRIKEPSGKWVSIKERVVSLSTSKDKLSEYIV